MPRRHSLGTTTRRGLPISAWHGTIDAAGAYHYSSATGTSSPATAAFFTTIFKIRYAVPLRHRFHFDWAPRTFVSKSFSIGLPDMLSADHRRLRSEPDPRGFRFTRSRIVRRSACLSIGNMQVLGLRGYDDFAAANPARAGDVADIRDFAVDLPRRSRSGNGSQNRVAEPGRGWDCDGCRPLRHPTSSDVASLIGVGVKHFRLIQPTVSMSLAARASLRNRHQAFLMGFEDERNNLWAAFLLQQ